MHHKSKQIKHKTKVKRLYSTQKQQTGLRIQTKGGRKMMSTLEAKVNLPSMLKMKQGFQEAMEKKGLTIEDIRKITGIKRYEKENLI